MIIGNFYGIDQSVLKTFRYLIAEKSIPVTLDISQDREGLFNVKVISESTTSYECLAQKYDGVAMYFTDEPVQFKDDCTCEHCNSERFRRKLFLIRANGITKQVGSTCVDEYTGSKYLKELNKIFKVKETVQNLFEESKASPKYVLLEDVINKVISYISKSPYDKDYIRENLKNIKINEDIINEYSFKGFKQYFECKINNEPNNNFLRSCSDILAKDYVHIRFLGYAIWMAKDYFENKDTNAEISEYYGNEGDKIKDENLIIKDVKIIPIAGYSYDWYSCNTTYMYIIKFVNSDYVFVYRGDNDNIKIGNTLKSFTIKQHKEYNGVKQTVILRPKF